MKTSTSHEDDLHISAEYQSIDPLVLLFLLQVQNLREIKAL